MNARQAVEKSYERIAEDGQRPVWISVVDKERALARAAEIDASPKPLPLAGLTFAVKDNIDVESLETTAGCPAYAYRPTTSATVVERPSAWARVKRNTSVRIGGTAMALLVLIALLAPWLGTVDPSLFDPASRDLLPGQRGEITTLEGEQLQHR